MKTAMKCSRYLAQFGIEGQMQQNSDFQSHFQNQPNPYDFFSLVELVKIDAEVTFANIENDDKGQKAIKKVEKKSSAESSKIGIATKGINIARGKGRLDR